jgi:hypothetical protein
MRNAVQIMVRVWDVMFPKKFRDQALVFVKWCAVQDICDGWNTPPVV